MKRLALSLCVGFIALGFIACDKDSHNATETQKVESNNAISQTTTLDSIESINMKPKSAESRNTTSKLETAQIEIVDGKDSQCNINGESTLYNEWARRYSGYTWSDNGAINKAYSFTLPMLLSI
ncbi:hypothetical protein CCZ01_06995 [Helicobacter monodelphidis]|uniref:hypothetical protein n=1 Tax=Helicobacter sp. 15-1451 TaxID=2004995 RepID=UPI000DCBC6D1|nr:hypothetical protein [Helicobacter sp. 15-1451]RAX57202.1 hypothetical protein CCZ01_06995 [Helicobacter sp. 15-1451]